MTRQALNRCTICQRIWPRGGTATACPHCGAADTIESYYEPDQATTAVPSRLSRAFDAEDDDLRLRRPGPSQAWVGWLALVLGLCLLGLATVGGMVMWAALRPALNPAMPPPPPVAVMQDNPVPDVPQAPEELPAPEEERDLRLDRERLPAPDIERLPGAADPRDD
jgi:hypothetical protein